MMFGHTLFTATVTIDGRVYQARFSGDSAILNDPARVKHIESMLRQELAAEVLKNADIEYGQFNS